MQDRQRGGTAGIWMVETLLFCVEDWVLASIDNWYWCLGVLTITKNLHHPLIGFELVAGFRCFSDGGPYPTLQGFFKEYIGFYENSTHSFLTGPDEIVSKVNKVKALASFDYHWTTIWSKYATANLTIKMLRDQAPVRLLDHLRETIYFERRSSNVIKFYDNSRKKSVNKQYVFDEICVPTILRESNCSVWLLLKKVFFKQSTPSENLLGMCCNGPGSHHPIMAGTWVDDYARKGNPLQMNSATHSVRY